MSNNTIKRISIDEFYKCSNIWDLKKCPFTDKFIEEIKSGNRMTFAYEKENAFIGEGSLVMHCDEEGYTITGKRVYLSRLIVKKECRNKGIGGAILDYLINKANEMGFSEISLGVDTDNEDALHLYRKYGFEIFETAEDEYGTYYRMLRKL